MTVVPQHDRGVADRRGAGGAEAFIGGLRWAFGASAVLALGIVVLAVLLPSRLPDRPDTVPASGSSPSSR